MTICVLTLFPDMLAQALSHSIIGRAAQKGIVQLEFINIRDFAFNKHKQVDDYPYGGGAGMVMAAPPVLAAWKYARGLIEGPCKGVYMSPQGKTLDQPMVQALSQEKNLIILCGHYEGVDERAIEQLKPLEISIGDYVLTGGEIPALAVIDSVVRLLPGVLNKAESHMQDSFSDGLLEYPQYTRPYDLMGEKVPEILLSGHHEKINQWRREASIKRTWERRRDLFETAVLDEKDRLYLEKLQHEKTEEILTADSIKPPQDGSIPGLHGGD